MTASHTISRAAAALVVLTVAALSTIPARADADPCPICEAPIPGESVSSASSQTVGFVGLRWSFGSDAPAVTAGVRHTRTEIDERVLGVKLDISLDLKTDLTFTPTIRLLGLAGNRDIQGELGLGFQTSDWQGLVAAGVQLSYFNAGANLTFDGTLSPYAEINGLGRPSAPVLIDGEMTCSNPAFWLVPVPGDYEIEPYDTILFTVDLADVVDNFTCFDPT